MSSDVSNETRYHFKEIRFPKRGTLKHAQKQIHTTVIKHEDLPIAFH